MIKSPHFVLIFFILTTQLFYPSTTLRESGGRYYPVTKVVDGDTFWVDDGSEKGLKIRLIGVDAPESRRTRSKEIAYYGQESKVYLTGLIGGMKVRLEMDVDSLDYFKRTLAYVFLEDDTFVNALLVKEGYASVMTVPPNIKFAEEFTRLARNAREGKKGLWRE